MKQNTCKILIVEDNRDYSSILHDYISLQPDMEVVGVLYDGGSVSDTIMQKNPDIVLLDIIMPKADGITVLEQINNIELNKKPEFLIISALCHDRITQKALMLGAKYFLIKPFNLETLIEKIRDLIPNKNLENKKQSTFKKESLKLPIKDGEAELAKLLINLGIPANLNGHHYIRTAVLSFLEGTGATFYITKDIYPLIAKLHKVTPTMVERSIRSAIERAWKYNSTNLLQILYNSKLVNKNTRPTNAEFIAALADRIRLSINKIDRNMVD